MNHKQETHRGRSHDVRTSHGVCAGLWQSFVGHLGQDGACFNSVVIPGPSKTRVIQTLSVSNKCKESFPELQTALSTVNPTCSFC